MHVIECILDQTGMQFLVLNFGIREKKTKQNIYKMYWLVVWVGC